MQLSTWGVEFDLKTFMRREVPSPKTSPRPMLATKRYRNFRRMSNTVDVLNTSVPFKACTKF